MKKIFVITYQPKEKSDKQLFVDTFINESQNAGNEVKVLNIHDMEIEYLKLTENDVDMELTPELKLAQDNILWADQIVLVYSVWCLSVPAKLKSFIERIFQKDVLVGYGDMGPKPILKDKTMVVIQSYSMPYFVMKYIYGDIPFKFLKIVFQNWCGFKIVKRFDIDMTEYIDKKRSQKFVKDIKKFVSKNK